MLIILKYPYQKEKVLKHYDNTEKPIYPVGI